MLNKRFAGTKSGGANSNPKAPRLRFKPGEFFRNRKSGQLYCAIYVYRLMREPNIWLFYLEERNDFSPPGTMASLMCRMLGAQVRVEANQSVVYQPFRSERDVSMHFMPLFYAHGDAQIATSKMLLNEFDLVSSGEILTQL